MPCGHRPLVLYLHKRRGLYGGPMTSTPAKHGKNRLCGPLYSDFWGTALKTSAKPESRHRKHPPSHSFFHLKFLKKCSTSVMAAQKTVPHDYADEPKHDHTDELTSAFPSSLRS